MFADKTYIRPSGSNKYLVKVETDFHILLPNKMLPNNNVKEVPYKKKLDEQKTCGETCCKSGHVLYMKFKFCNSLPSSNLS